MTRHMTDRFSEYIANELDRVQRAEVDAHLESCTLCREEFDSLLRLWARLGTMPKEQPGPDVRVRFTAMLEAYKEGSKVRPSPASPVAEALNTLVARFWPTQPVLQFGLAIVLVVVGVIAGSQLTAPPEHRSELTELRSEVQSIGHLLALSLLNQQSASERLKGVKWTSQIEGEDDQILSALLNALKYDQNVNVRLASIDALGRYLSVPGVEAQMVGTIPDQASPLVQIALVDLMVERGTKTSADLLQRYVKDSQLMPVVRQRIEQGINDIRAEHAS